MTVFATKNDVECNNTLPANKVLADTKKCDGGANMSLSRVRNQHDLQLYEKQVLNRPAIDQEIAEAAIRLKIAFPNTDNEIIRLIVELLKDGKYPAHAIASGVKQLLEEHKYYSISIADVITRVKDIADRKVMKYYPFQVQKMIDNSEARAGDFVKIEDNLYINITDIQ
jgi:hypothetical protein